MVMLNGFNVERFNEYIESVKKDPTKADRNPKIIGTWEGKDIARVEMDGITVHTGGKNYFSGIKLVLAALIGCDIEVVATHASLLGLKIENLTIEASGYFNVQSFLGIKDAPSSEYQSISYTVNLDAPDATPEQIKALKEACERSSPVGDTLTHVIPLKLEFKTNQ